MLAHLYPIRDRVLASAALKDGETLLDVGCGDGLIGFGALQANPGVRVIFSDVSAALVAHVRELAAEMTLIDRCEFVETSADALRGVNDASVDAVTTRSVLIYVARKDAAFREFYRVLKPGGRLSIFEPINIFGYEQTEACFWGFDVTPVVDAARKLRAQTRALQPPETDPMLNFDERDLFRMVQDAGFAEIHMEYRAHLGRWPEMPWSAVMCSSPNPKLPSWDESMNEVLTPAEKEAFIAHVRPQFEQRKGRSLDAAVYLRATKE